VKYINKYYIVSDVFAWLVMSLFVTEVNQH